MINEKKKSGKKDACYHKVKSRYSVWPSAYASGALVKCRNKGAKNWGNSRKDEALHTAYFNFALQLVEEEYTDPGMETKKDKKPSTPEKPETTSTTEQPKTTKPKSPGKARSFLRKSMKGPEAIFSTTPGQAPTPEDQAELQKVLRRSGRDERTAQAAARGTSRAKVSFRTITNPDGSKSVQPVKQGSLASYTRTGDETRVRALARGVTGSYPLRQLRAKKERAFDRGIGRTAAMVTRAALAKFRSARAKGKSDENLDFSHTEYKKIGSIIAEKSAAWTRSEGKNPSGGLNAKGVASYRAQNPGSKLKTAVTTKPSKLKKGSKAAKRRKSFCARMKGMRKRQKSSNNTGKDRLSLSLKKWNC